MSTAAIEHLETWPPAGAEPLVSFIVAGDPKGAGSKDAIPLGKRDRSGRFHPFTRPDGTPMVNVVDSTGPAGKAWRKAIKAAAVVALDHAQELADGPLAVRVTFYGARRKADFGTGRNAGVLKPGSDRYPHRSDLPDGTKLGRALEDALNAVVWTDDRRVCDMWWSRRFGDDPGAIVDIMAMPRAVTEAQAAELGGQLALA